MVGKTLSHYEILEQLGAGGMGEVYLAKDARLGRRVAVKVLPMEYATDADRRARFEREARAAAALNHPNIAGVHDVGFEDGVHFIVQEYIEGRSLRQLFSEGRLALERGLGIGTEIAAALAAAHGAGVVHRDLKPDNVIVTAEGHAKVLDFGLAKLLEPDSAATSGDPNGTRSPTVAGTTAGQILGTAGYMAPEQVEGRAVDHRADIFALGCVLYEMTTGQRPFAGKSVHDTLHRIVDEQPRPPVEVDPRLPLKLQWIVDKCLKKNPDRRYQSARELVVDLGDLAADVAAGGAITADGGTGQRMYSGTPPPAGPAGWLSERRRAVALPLVVALMVATGLIAAAAVWLGVRSGPDPRIARRFEVATPGVNVALVSGDITIGISPDGRWLAWVSFGPEEASMMVRRLDQPEARPVYPYGPSSYYPRFSPDNRWLLVTGSEGLYRVAVSGGGEPLRLAEGDPDVWPFADWADADTVIYSRDRALWRVDVAGGPAELVTELPDEGETDYWLTDLHPDGEYGLLERSAEVGVGVVELETGEIVAEIANPAQSARFVSRDQIVFGRGRSLEVVGFDRRSGRIIGTPVPVVEGVYAHPENEIPNYAVSGAGDLVYIPADAVSNEFSIVRVDRDGGETVARTYQDTPPLRLRMSPDDTRVAIQLENPTIYEADIRVWHLDRGGGTQITHEGDDSDPVWTPDGERIVYSSEREEGAALFWRRADGLGQEEAIPVASPFEHPYSFNPEGTELAVYTLEAREGDRDIHVRSVGGEWERRPILVTRFNERSPAFSPDGRWLAYVSDESGQDEVYVLRYPELDEKHLISVGGGREPAWSRDGGELYYRFESAIFAVKVSTTPEFRAESPELLFDSGAYWRQVPWHGGRTYDVSADGRFVLPRFDAAVDVSEGRMVVVLDWLAEVDERLTQSPDALRSP